VLTFATPAQLILGLILVMSSLGVILLRKPVHASLSFLLTLLTLATLYLQLSAEFIAVMQILVYAGAILVIFMFVIVLFQDAHQQISSYPSKSYFPLLLVAGLSLFGAFVFLGEHLIGMKPSTGVSQAFGKVQSLGETIYIEFFFPFEAVILLFLVAIIGSLYIAKKES